MKIKRVHPLADSFPMIEGPEYEAFKADVEKNGQREPILVSPDGTLLDGRNRIKACEELGIEPKIKLEKDDPKKVILALNVHRRHMTKDQRVMLLTMQGVEYDPGVNSGRPQFEKARQILAARPDIAQRVLAGKIIIPFAFNQAFPKPKAKPRAKAKAAKHLIRVIIPDSHGEHIDRVAAGCFLEDLAKMKPDEIIMLGDHLDAGGTFSSHQRNYTHELTECYADDVAATNWFLDQIQERAPNAVIDYLEGNHEQHIDRWAAREFHSHKDAELALDGIGPVGVLNLVKRGIRYYKRSEMYDGLAIQGTIKRGKCHFVHGVSAAKHADSVHLERFGSNVVFGHVHRSLSVVSRNASSAAYGAWCPGTLAKLQPLYAHTRPTTWTHGYGIQFVNQSTGTFMHINVPIYEGRSLLFETVDFLKGRR